MDWIQDGIKITLRERDGRFRVEGDDNTYMTLQEARSRATSQAKRGALKPLNQAVLIEDGSLITVVGIHGNTGDWKFVGANTKPLEHNHRAVYYPNAKVERLLLLKRNHLAAITLVDADLEAFKIEMSSRGGRPNADDIVRYHERFEARYAEIDEAQGG